jgi:hypothetical protein
MRAEEERHKGLLTHKKASHGEFQLTHLYVARMFRGQLSYTLLNQYLCCKIVRNIP